MYLSVLPECIYAYYMSAQCHPQRTPPPKNSHYSLIDLSFFFGFFVLVLCFVLLRLNLNYVDQAGLKFPALCLPSTEVRGISDPSLFLDRPEY